MRVCTERGGQCSLAFWTGCVLPCLGLGNAFVVVCCRDVIVVEVRLLLLLLPVVLLAFSVASVAALLPLLVTVVI